MIILYYLYLRKTALLKWKKRLGKSATYSNLICAFEAAGYKHYADSIKRMFGIDDDADYSSDDESFPRPQPPTYPIQPDPISSLPEPLTSPSDLYYLVDPDTVKTLPEGKL